MGLTVGYPEIYITTAAKEKLEFYIDIAPDEISGFGTVKKEEDKFVIEDVFIFPQESSSAATEISGEQLGLGLLQLVEDGVAPENVRLWWHSHVRMSASFSSIDDDTMDKTFSTADWFISVVGNKHGEFCARLDIHSPFHVYVDEIPLKVVPTEVKKNCPFSWCGKEPAKDSDYCEAHQNLYDAMVFEVLEKVKKPIFAPVVAYKNNGHGIWTPMDGNPNGKYPFPYEGRAPYEIGINKRELKEFDSSRFKDDWKELDDSNYSDAYCIVVSCDEAPMQDGEFCDYHDYIAGTIQETELKGVDFDDETLLDLIDVYEMKGWYEDGKPNLVEVSDDIFSELDAIEQEM